MTEGFPAGVKYILLDIQDTPAFEQKTLRISPGKQVVHRNLPNELQSEVTPNHRACSNYNYSTSSGSNNLCSILQSDMAHATPSATPSSNPSSHMTISLQNGSPSNILTQIPSDHQSNSLSTTNQSLSTINHSDRI